MKKLCAFCLLVGMSLFFVSCVGLRPNTEQVVPPEESTTDEQLLIASYRQAPAEVVPGSEGAFVGRLCLGPWKDGGPRGKELDSQYTCNSTSAEYRWVKAIVDGTTQWALMPIGENGPYVATGYRQVFAADYFGCKLDSKPEDTYWVIVLQGVIKSTELPGHLKTLEPKIP